MDVKVLADSISPDGFRIVTNEITTHRFVLPEMNTHRVFSRNSASSRAIPVKKVIEKVMSDPALPVFWGKYQKGMSASVELEPEEIAEAKVLWLEARDSAVNSAKHLMNIGGFEQGLHKQITNRLLEPWMWQTVICTATEWSNFFALRCSPFAQPEIRAVAEMIRDAMEASEPTLLQPGEWHLPLIREEDREAVKTHPDPNLLLKLSTARCARVSYLTHDGRRDLEADIALHDTLVSSGHLSPCEHPATPMTPEDLECNSELGGNFRGWIQYRKTLPFEHDFGQATKAQETK